MPRRIIIVSFSTEHTRSLTDTLCIVRKNGEVAYVLTKDPEAPTSADEEGNMDIKAQPFGGIYCA